MFFVMLVSGVGSSPVQSHYHWVAERRSGVLEKVKEAGRDREAKSHRALSATTSHISLSQIEVPESSGGSDPSDLSSPLLLDISLGLDTSLRKCFYTIVSFSRSCSRSLVGFCLTLLTVQSILRYVLCVRDLLIDHDNLTIVAWMEQV